MNRKIVFTIVSVFSSSLLLAQEPIDALRFSWMTSHGTARAQAIGGATTALGGDITSLYTNPAGLGMYKTSEFVFSPGVNITNNQSSYRGSSATDGKSSFNYGPVGLVYGMPSYSGSKWKNTALGVSISRSASFNNRIFTSGSNNQSSFSEKYLDQLIRNNATNLDDAVWDYPYGASLGLNTFLIDPTFDNNGQLDGYASNASVNTGVNQQHTIDTRGNISDFSIGLGSNYNEVFHIGGAININSLTFTRTSTFNESDATNDTNNDFNYFTAEDYLKTDGVGVGVRLGIMAKPIEALRVGLSFHSPTWYSFKDVYTAELTTDTEGYEGVKRQSSLDLNEGYAGEFNYRYRTPMKLAVGASWFFGAQGDVKSQKGFISADLEYVNYRQATMSAQSGNTDDKQYFQDLNRAIDDVFGNAVNARIGGELKFETVMVRAGVAYYGNPYTNKFFYANPGDNVNAGRTSISGGLGWRNKGVFVDLACVYQMFKDAYYPYELDTSDFDVARLKSSQVNLLMTVGFKF